MADRLSQLPDGPDIEVVAGDPIGWTGTCTGHTLTSPELKLFTRPGQPTTVISITPTLPTADTWAVALSAANTAALQALAGLATVQQQISWTVAARLDGATEATEIAAGTLTIAPEGSRRIASSTSSGTYTYTVASGVTLSYTVTIGGVTSAQMTAAIAAAIAGMQPLDADLTAIAALTTTPFGRSLLELANAGALAGDAAFSSRYVPSLADLTVTRNSAGQVTSFVEAGVTTSVTRNSAGQVATITHNGTTKTVTRDSSGRVTGVA